MLHCIAAQHITLYHGLAIYREVTFVNVTSVAENTDTMWHMKDFFLISTSFIPIKKTYKNCPFQ